uniref:Uncharacterized protein n=1 Tax=viral metagenome TaxID=1070528 RepID=A0A6M3INZ1_9ZZZZ
MSIYGNWKTATITIATDADLSAAVDLGANYDLLNIIIPTVDACRISVYVCATSDGTYQALGDSVTTATTTGGYSTTLKLGGWEHIKVKTSTNQTANRSFSVRGMRY